MKSSLVAFGVAFGLLLTASPSFAAKKHFKADIEGSAVGSPGTGVGNFTFDDVTKRLCGKATYTGLTGGAVTGAALKEGDGFTLVKSLPASASPIVIDVTLSDTEMAFLEAGPMYIAIGNAAHAVAAGEQMNGEVNGELVPDPAGVEQPCSGAALSDGGATEVPSSDAGTSTETPATPSPIANADAGATAPPAANEDTGCSTSGASTGPTAMLAIGVAAALLAAKRRRR